MLKLKQKIDILSEIGGIKTLADANTLFERKCDKENLIKLNYIKNADALIKIANAISMINPDSVFVHTGSDADLKKVREMSIKMGAERPLAMKGHTIHFDLPEEQGRVVDKTLYIVNEDEEISSLARKITRKDAYEHVKKYMTDIGKGKNLLVGFFNRGPVGAKAAIPALEITTSPYVMHSADILYRHVYDRFDDECKRRGDFFTNVHSEGLNRLEDLPNARVLMDRSWLTTFSMLFTYAGNTLLLKKGNHRFAVDLAVYFGQEKELSEHMFITGMRGKGGRKTYFAGAAPSGCGKTTTAMVGTDFIGDDLAQLWIADDGTLRGVNPECGIFGIVQDVNREGDPYLMKVMRGEGYEVIWSNVLIDEKDEPHWVGDGDGIPGKGVNYMGEWHPGKTDVNGKPVPMSHPNSRATLSNSTIENYNGKDAEDPNGVEIKVITYSGRDADTMPPVWVARNVDHGVMIGASVLSEATATEVGVKGERPQPWANEPFIPGPLGHYMDAQFKFFNSAKLKNKPIISGLNYFLTHGARGGEGKKLLGEKRDVKVWLGWLELKANGDVDAIDTPIGFIPKYEDLKRLFSGIGKEYPKDLYDKQFSFYVDNIIARISLMEESYRKEKDIPARAFEVYKKQRDGLTALKAKYGAVVSVEQLIKGV
jgi:phosphoenolpyruvate carboxykinase (GTP)